MPFVTRIDCPSCGKRLRRKPGGRCPACGAEVAARVQAVRTREERIEQVVAIIATLLVVLVLAVGGGRGLVEGVAAYAVGGALVWFLAKRLFF